MWGRRRSRSRGDPALAAAGITEHTRASAWRRSRRQIESGRAQSAVALAAAIPDLVAAMVQPVRWREHALRGRHARRAPLHARALTRLRALLVRAIGRIVHAQIRRRAGRTEMEAGPRAARQTREVRARARVKYTRRSRATDVRHHHGGVPTRSVTDRCRLARFADLRRSRRWRTGMFGVGRVTTSHDQRSNNHDHMAHRAVIARWFTKRSFVERSHLGVA